MKDLIEAIEQFAITGEDMMDVSMCKEIPEELIQNDVYSFSYIFKNEDVAINYVIKNDSSNKLSFDELKNKLHEDDIGCTGKYDLSSTEVHCKKGNFLQVMRNGTVLLCDLY